MEIEEKKRKERNQVHAILLCSVTAAPVHPTQKTYVSYIKKLIISRFDCTFDLTRHANKTKCESNFRPNSIKKKQKKKLPTVERM